MASQMVLPCGFNLRDLINKIVGKYLTMWDSSDVNFELCGSLWLA